MKQMRHTTTCIPRILGVWDTLKNYFFMYKNLTRPHVRAELASAAYLGLGIF